MELPQVHLITSATASEDNNDMWSLVAVWGNWTACSVTCGPGGLQTRTEIAETFYLREIEMACNQFDCDGK